MPNLITIYLMSEQQKQLEQILETDFGVRLETWRNQI